ncbi:hypothetical protein SWYG_00111 [Synechococcus phage S-IOM18]|jgi:hypothetical protein|uniref:Uncharacterized protein n=1 Tax=Synechococcus phage S-IOM18 TaxID=754039 RepID=R9TPQ0_9CAUD|nr:hypothetical protein SWYG_00111 [Synechococcus phage S-IOM18]AGN33622.1 hypothetical protein SWYG_00111 [Synechococcus phage S-IOM18]|tara:strand:+ start:318 stop:569 length:252 start_codon:yes stop_codon:yes gene_type:complete
MFILTDAKTGGVYAVRTVTNSKIIHVFEEEDDAIRYKEQLSANDYTDEFDVMEVEPEIIAINCNNYGYQYSIVSKDDLVIPPP